ncbi:hypothetical protein [Variovorax ginsengisoli]|uniref:Uncharacterized protein n=1 Tax=Variovorax ginsengisoli TaxID=363844 RepID=A0ABT9S2Y6_9BURK|nr:hypothetical protein [Variovorax ginsengisoli]MDP9898708.1 hypothetical protein [Variovorax ginsengisoli]
MNSQQPAAKPHRQHLLKQMLQLVAFGVATLLATGVLVLAGLNERGDAPESLAFITHKAQGPR